MQKIIAIIPARYESQRFPGKLLAKLGGKTLIQNTYENASKCDALNEIFVATDDQRIFDHVQEFGGKAVMTSSSCPTGTDRIVETAKSLDKNSIIVNVQGDEPLVKASVIKAVALELVHRIDLPMTTAIVPIKNPEDLQCPNIVKCVMDKNGRALYFSRAPIPHSRDGYRGVHHAHLGIYAYRHPFLMTYASLSPTPLQQSEALEQLKVLEHGYAIGCVVVDDLPLGVDTPEDLKKVQELICKQSSSS